MKETTYWNGNGKYQAIYDEQYSALIPDTGKAGSLQGEVLRAATRLYNRWFNDGDRIAQYGPRPDSSAEDAWGFLHEAYTLLQGSEGREALKTIADIVADAALAPGEANYGAALECLVDAATLYAASRPLVATEEDFVGNGWNEVCIEECRLRTEGDEDGDEE